MAIRAQNSAPLEGWQGERKTAEKQALKTLLGQRPVTTFILEFALSYRPGKENQSCKYMSVLSSHFQIFNEEPLTSTDLTGAWELFAPSFFAARL